MVNGEACGKVLNGTAISRLQRPPGIGTKAQAKSGQNGLEIIRAA